MTFTEQLPNANKQETICFFTINHNGITLLNDYLEWEMSIVTRMDMQVDVFGITLPNLDFNNGAVRENFTQKGRHLDKCIHMALSTSKQTILTILRDQVKQLYN